MGILDGLVNQLLTGDNLKDYKHANKLFVGDNFRLAPKMGFLYHVFFDLDPSLSRMAHEQIIEAGMLVKSVDLPKFSIDTKTLNSYNKPNIVQNKIKYDSINISFHDDNADVIRNLWFDYYHFYYRDSDMGFADKSGLVNQNYYLPTKYGDRTNNNFGYTPRNYSVFTNSMVQQFVKAIRIYSLHKKRFSEYTLVNPMITSFRHGQHAAGANEPMTHEMTINYEFVLYAGGNVSKNTVNGFADIHYDTSPSPLSVAGGGTRTLLGPGGIFDTADEVVEDLSKDPPNYAAALFKGFRGVNNLRNMNLKNAAKAEFSQLSMDILKGDNPLNRVNIPTSAGLGVGVAATAVMGLTGQTKDSKVSASAITSNGTGVGTPSTAKTAGTSLVGPAASVAGGSSTTAAVLPTNASGKLTGTNDLNKVVAVNTTTGAASSASLLKSTSTAQQKIQNIPGNSANQAADTYISTNASSPNVLEEAASTAASINIANAKDNQAAKVKNLASSTSTPPATVAAAQLNIVSATVNITTTTTTTTPTATSTTTSTINASYTAFNARLAILKANPNANLNDDAALILPTNQGKVGPNGQ